MPQNYGVRPDMPHMPVFPTQPPYGFLKPKGDPKTTFAPIVRPPAKLVTRKAMTPTRKTVGK